MEIGGDRQSLGAAFRDTSPALQERLASVHLHFSLNFRFPVPPVEQCASCGDARLLRKRFASSVRCVAYCYASFSAAEISDNAAFSASVTFVPPKPMSPPSASAPASATFSLIW